MFNKTPYLQYMQHKKAPVQIVASTKSESQQKENSKEYFTTVETVSESIIMKE